MAWFCWEMVLKGSKTSKLVYLRVFCDTSQFCVFLEPMYYCALCTTTPSFTNAARRSHIFIKSVFAALFFRTNRNVHIFSKLPSIFMQKLFDQISKAYKQLNILKMHCAYISTTCTMVAIKRNNIFKVSQGSLFKMSLNYYFQIFLKLMFC